MSDLRTSQKSALFPPLRRSAETAEMASILYSDEPIVNQMWNKLWAGVVILLAVLPFTAPFSTLDVSDLVDRSGTHLTAPVTLTVASVEASDGVGSIVPPMRTKLARLSVDHSQPFDRTVVDIAASLAIAASMLEPSCPPSQSVLPPGPLQLRL